MGLSDSSRMRPDRPLLGVVGPCAAGKSTLIRGLSSLGINARHIAQEHSYVQDMWQRLTNPRYLVFLEVSFPLTIQRKQLNWEEVDFQEQLRRLQHARSHSDLVINTDDLTADAVLGEVVRFLSSKS